MIIKLRSVLCVFPVLLWLSISGGCLRNLGSHEQLPVALRSPQQAEVLELKVEEPKELSNEEVSLLVEEKLMSTVYLEVTSTVYQMELDGRPSADPFVVHSYMAKDAFKTLLYGKDGKLERGFSFVDGQVQEYSSFRNQIDEYPASFRNGIDGSIHALQTDCLIGNLMYSWVGVPRDSELSPSMDMARSMSIKIENGVKEADANERGHDCYVFHQTRNGDPSDVIENVVYIDKKTYYPMRWDITRHGGTGSIIKREFGITFDNAVPEGFDWKIPAGDTKVAEGK